MPSSTGPVPVSFAAGVDEVAHVLFDHDACLQTLQDGDPPLTREVIEAAIRSPHIRLVCASVPEAGVVGVFSFFRRSDSAWEMHTAFLAGHRGKTALSAARAAIALMREFEGAAEITTTVPRFNRAASLMAVAAGFERRGVAPFPYIKHGGAHEVLVYALKTEGGMSCH